MLNALILAEMKTPPSDVTDPANTLIGWGAWIIAAVCVGRLMFLGAKWGLSKVSAETFDHTPREILMTMSAGILTMSAGTWVTFLQNG
jgi:hypothetical protein